MGEGGHTFVSLIIFSYSSPQSSLKLQLAKDLAKVTA